MPPASVLFAAVNAMIIFALAQYDSEWPVIGRYALGIVGAGTGFIAAWMKAPKDAKIERAARQNTATSS